MLTTECGEVIHLKGSGSASGKESDGSIRFEIINPHHTTSEKFKKYNGVAAVGVCEVSPEGQTSPTMGRLPIVGP